MQILVDLLNKTRIHDYLRRNCSNESPCYLVGGAVRDSILGIDVEVDFDFALPSDPSAFAQKFAAEFNGTWFMLDEQRLHSRVVHIHDHQRIVCDFIPFRAPSLDNDLRKRDFTINAIAWPCHLPLDVDNLIDPMAGIRDIHKRLLRACNAQAFIDDPLRTLKGVRHATALNFDFEPATFALIKEAVSHIDQVAPERLRAELARIFSAENAWRGVNLLQQTGLLVEIFGHSAQQQGLEKALGYMQRLHRALHALDSELHAGLLQILASGVEEFFTLSSLLKFAAFFQGYQPIALKNVLRALRFSNRSIDFLVTAQHLDFERLLSELDQLPDTHRARARWVFALGKEPLAVLFLTLLHTATDRDPLPLLESCSAAYLAHTENGKLPDLLDGDWLRTTYNLDEGPVVGRLLECLRQAELQGEISTPQDARRWLHEHQKMIDKILLEHL